MKTTDELVKLYWESFHLIEDNPDLTTDQIPQHLLEAWLSNQIVVVTLKIQQYFAICIFELIHDAYEGDTEDTDPVILKYRFDSLRYILLHELINRQFNIDFKPIKVFEMSAYKMPLDFTVQEQDLERYNALVAKYSTF